MAIACGAVLVLSVWTFWMAVRPPRIAIPGTPQDFRLTAEDVTITTDDGVRLAAWLIPSAAANAPGVILLHGYPANKADLLPTGFAPPDTNAVVVSAASGAGIGALKARIARRLSAAVSEVEARLLSDLSGDEQQQLRDLLERCVRSQRKGRRAP